MSWPAACVLSGIFGAGLVWFGVLLGRSRKPVSYEEFRKIRDEGYNDAIEAAASCMDDFAKSADNPKEVIRHAGLIRKLKMIGWDIRQGPHDSVKN